MKQTSKRDWKTPTILIVLAIVAIVFFFQRPREPAFQGRKLSEWVLDLNDKAEAARRTAAEQAIREMGTNIVPNLLRMLSSQAALSSRQMAGSQNQTEMQHEEALAAFRALGKVTLPVLTDLLDGESGTTAAYALSGIGLDGVPPLLAALTNQDSSVRERVELGLELSPATSTAFHPVLLANLQDPNEGVRAYAARALGKSGIALDAILPGLIAALKDPSDVVRLQVVEALGRHGTNAAPAILPLLEVAKTSPGKISRAAFNALGNISPEAAERAGAP